MPRREAIDPDQVRRECEETTRRSHTWAGEHGDCEICRAIEEGDEARVRELIRADPVHRELVRVMSLDEAGYDAWLKSLQAAVDDAH